MKTAQEAPSATPDEQNRDVEESRVAFLLLPHVHLLDLAGPAQVFYEANGFGGAYRLSFCGEVSRVRTSQGVVLAELEALPQLGAGDLVVVPGIDSQRLDELDRVPVDWLRASHAAGAAVCSICSAAHVLARSGLLDGRRCTTHWKVVERLRREVPAARVLENRLFVGDGGIHTSAGVASGIDLALWLVEQRHGPLVTARVAREIVVYLRRDGASGQSSVYLDHRTHLHPGVHRVQDWLIGHPDANPTLEELADLAGMSARNLTRVFRQATGTTVKQFSTRLRLELAVNLLRNPGLTVDAVAARCGFADARQLRVLWKRSYGATPSVWRSRAGSGSLPPGGLQR